MTTARRRRGPTRVSSVRARRRWTSVDDLTAQPPPRPARRRVVEDAAEAPPPARSPGSAARGGRGPLEVLRGIDLGPPRSWSEPVAGQQGVKPGHPEHRPHAHGWQLGVRPLDRDGIKGVQPRRRARRSPVVVEVGPRRRGRPAHRCVVRGPGRGSAAARTAPTTDRAVASAPSPQATPALAPPARASKSRCIVTGRTGAPATRGGAASWSRARSEDTLVAPGPPRGDCAMRRPGARPASRRREHWARASSVAVAHRRVAQVPQSIATEPVTVEATPPCPGPRTRSRSFERSEAGELGDGGEHSRIHRASQSRTG